MLERALRIEEESYPPGHPSVNDLLNNLGYTYRELGRPDAAREAPFSHFRNECIF